MLDPVKWRFLFLSHLANQVFVAQDALGVILHVFKSLAALVVRAVALRELADAARAPTVRPAARRLSSQHSPGGGRVGVERG